MYGTRIAKKHNALIFDGIKNYVEVADSAELNPAKEVTVAAWVKRFTQVEEGIVLKNPIATRNYRLYLYASGYGYPAFEIVDTTGTAYPIEWFTPFPLNEWHHLAGTFDGRYVKIYYDGELKNTRDIGFTVSIRQNSGDLWIGRINGSYFYGIIDKVRIYNRALTATEISKLYKGQNIANGLVLHLDFNELGGNKCLDLSGYKNDGTIHGARRSILRTGGLSFDGDNYVETTKGVYENGGTFTFMAWILFKSFPQTWNAIFGQRNFPRLQYWTVDKSLKFNTWVDGVDTEFSSLSFEALGVWKHITVIVYPKDNVDFYIDGAFLNRATNVGTITHTDPATNPISLATPTVPGVNWPSVILDEIRIYNRALSQDEIRSLYRGKSITKGLVLYFPMNEYSGNKVYDNSGFENHGVIYT